MAPSRRDSYQSQYNALRTLQAPWRSHWQLLADYVLPRRVRFTQGETYKGTAENSRIINNTASRSGRVLASGLMASVTSPARPWFRLTTAHPELAEIDEVKAWLSACEGPIRAVLSRSNFYNSLSDGVYLDLSVFGTAADMMEEDETEVLRCYPLPIGTYYLAADANGRVNTIYSEHRMTVSQIMERFGGGGQVSRAVQDAYRLGNYHQAVDVVNVIEPNRDRDTRKVDNRNMPFRSCWFELAGEKDQFLSESGYREFPVLAPRWSTRAGDVYGRSPMMECLGDVMALQLAEKRKAEVIDKIVRPPMVGPESLRTGRPSLVPGDVTYLPNGMANQRFEPAVVVPPQAIGAIDESIRNLENRIQATCFADLWLLMAQDERLQPQTAEEVRAKKEERMLQLGPVLEQLNEGLLRPAIHRSFAALNRRGLLPPPPDVLVQQGAEYEVEFVSILHQALKTVGIASIERSVGFVGNLVGVYPEAADMLDIDKVVEAHADASGLPPDLLRGDEARAQIREQRAAAARVQQAQQGMDVAKTGAQAAQVLANTDLQGNTALNRLLNTLGPAAAQGGFPDVAGAVP